MIENHFEEIVNGIEGTALADSMLAARRPEPHRDHHHLQPYRFRQRQGEVTLALLTSGTSEITATVAPEAGVVDPIPGNDTVTLSIAD